MRKITLEDALRGVVSTERQWLLDDLDLPGTTGLVRFENLNSHSPGYGDVRVVAAGLMHRYATLEIAWTAPPGYSRNSQMTPVGYYAHAGYDTQDNGSSRPAHAAANAAE